MTNFYEETDIALDAVGTNPNGLVEAATGTGKGVVIERDVGRHLYNNGGTAIIVGHRILLMQQLMERIVKCSIDTTSTVPFKRIGVHSGGSSQIETDILEERIALAEHPDTMCPSIEKLEETLTDSLNRGIDNAIYVTYHSLWKVLTVCVKLGIRPRLYCDEIHAVASDKDKWETVEQMCRLSDSYYAFSATVDKYRNKIEKVFGSRIYHLPANKAIELGLICQPQWMLAEVNGNREKNLAQGVVQAFIEFDSLNRLDVKSIVNCKDTKDLKTIAGSKQVKGLYQKYTNFMLAEISSERGCIVNGKKVDRRAWIKTINAHVGPMIVLHIDICNAGIDVPGFNLPIWTYLPASETYAIQGNGRGARLSDEDRVLLEQGKLSVVDRLQWHKPYNTVCLLAFTNTIEEDKQEFVEFIIRSRNQGFKVNDLASVAKNSGKKPDPFNNNAGQSSIIQSIQAGVDISLENEQIRELIAEIDENDPMSIFGKFELTLI
jgi:Type III restriction enzyme, res subunit